MSEIEDKTKEQKTAEGEVEGFKQELGPFVVAAEVTRMAMVFTDAKEDGNPIIFANDSFLKLTGYDRDEVLAQSFNFLMAQRADTEALQRIEAEFAGSEQETDICYRRKDGSEFWATVLISPVQDEQGEVVQHFASFVDLTRHKADQARSDMLIDELNHRVKNTLATVQSIVLQALRTTIDPAVIRESIESRLFALSRSHDLLSLENWHSAKLVDVVQEAMKPFGVANGRAERFEIAGADLRLPPPAALALGIAFNELATNAVKYGAFSNDAGRVAIGWSVEPSSTGERLVLCWRESGGPPVHPPSHRGVGSRVLERGLAHELRGHVDLQFEPSGLICTIDVPLPVDLRVE